MGLGPAAIKLNLELWQRGFFKNMHSVCDMGSQEIHLKLTDFESLINEACISTYKREDFINLAHWPKSPRCQSRTFYKMLGIDKYSCVDISNEYGAIPLDLNMPLEDKSLYGQYDLVTDYGTNEHVFNTAEAYRTMHRLCKKQGSLIIIQVVYNGNGYYAYDPSFFEGIAAANDYKILFSSYVISSKTPTTAGSPNHFLVPLSLELIDLLDWTKVSELGICYVMQKQSDSDFKFPYQDKLLSSIQGHYGYRLQFLPDPPSRSYIPLADLDEIPAENLLKILLNRVKRTPPQVLFKHFFSMLFRRKKIK